MLNIILSPFGTFAWAFQINESITKSSCYDIYFSIGWIVQYVLYWVHCIFGNIFSLFHLSHLVLGSGFSSSSFKLCGFPFSLFVVFVCLFFVIVGFSFLLSLENNLYPHFFLLIVYKLYAFFSLNGLKPDMLYILYGWQHNMQWKVHVLWQHTHFENGLVKKNENSFWRTINYVELTTGRPIQYQPVHNYK